MARGRKAHAPAKDRNRNYSRPGKEHASISGKKLSFGGHNRENDKANFSRQRHFTQKRHVGVGVNLGTQIQPRETGISKRQCQTQGQGQRHNSAIE